PRSRSPRTAASGPLTAAGRTPRSERASPRSHRCSSSPFCSGTSWLTSCTTAPEAWWTAITTGSARAPRSPPRARCTFAWTTARNSRTSGARGFPFCGRIMSSWTRRTFLGSRFRRRYSVRANSTSCSRSAPSAGPGLNGSRRAGLRTPARRVFIFGPLFLFTILMEVRMSTVDLTMFQAPEVEGTTVTMPDGSEIVLRPLMALGPEHDDLFMELIDAVSGLQAGEDNTLALAQIKAIMPVASRIIAAAAPSKAAAAKLEKLPLMARFQVLMGYLGDQDLG